ncbi:MAG: YIP1 family protein [Candidatus Kapabacteria bacterium]|jgi:hypothetical protein|nr:YIP1 family protein [Candidatus Kapabacteria bacterium]
MNEEQFSTSPDKASNDEASETTSWLSGFVDIITAPAELALRHVVYPARVIVFAALLSTFAATFVQFLYSKNDAIQDQMYAMQARGFEKMAQKQGVAEGQIEEQLDKLRKEQEFSLPKTLGVSLIFTLLSVFLYGLLFWILQRLFNSEPPPVSVIVALTNYTASISVIGFIITAFMQYAANSIATSPSPTLFINATENPYMLQFLGRINPFTIWEYLIAGFVVARHVGMSKTQGYAIGATALVITLMLTGGFAFAMASFLG